MHPLSEGDIALLVTKAAATAETQVDAAAVRREVEALQLSAQDKRTPVTLWMAAELAVWAAGNRAAALPLAATGFAFPAGSRAALYQKYFLLRAGARRRRSTRWC